MGNMFWELSDRQIAELSEEKVRTFIDIELMEQGILKMERPTFSDVDALVYDKKEFVTPVFIGEDGSTVESSVVFETREAAAEFLKLRPFVIERDWRLNCTIVKRVIDAKLDIKEQAEFSSIQKIRIELEKSAKAREENDTKMRAWREHNEKVDKASQQIWSAWFGAQRTFQHYKNIVSTFKNYVGLCSGDEDLAKTFLAKAFPPDEIEQAFEQCADLLAVEVPA